jgi:hypothetical protein
LTHYLANNMNDKHYISVSVSDSYSNNTNYKKNVETTEYPMSQSLFNELSSVIGFNDMNGKTYEEYVQKWKVRKEMSINRIHTLLDEK